MNLSIIPAVYLLTLSLPISFSCLTIIHVDTSHKPFYLTYCYTYPSAVYLRVIRVFPVRLVLSIRNSRCALTVCKCRYPGDSIRPVDPIVSDRIRVGFHRNPTSSIKNQSDPIWLLSDSLQSDSDEILGGIDRKRTNLRLGLNRL